MQGHHWLLLLVFLFLGYFIGANYKLGLPLIG